MFDNIYRIYDIKYKDVFFIRDMSIDFIRRLTEDEVAAYFPNYNEVYCVQLNFENIDSRFVSRNKLYCEWEDIEDFYK